MHARAILFTGINTVAFGSAEIPEPEAGEVLIEAAYTAVSPGTELRCLAGQQSGAAPWPFIPGYSLAGRVLANGPGTSLPPGTPVFCSGTTRSLDRGRTWGGHVSHAVVPESRAFVLPEGTDLRSAALAKLCAIALHGVRVANPQPGEQVAVVGLGPIGMLCARIYTLHGAVIAAADLESGRVELAQAAGLHAFVPRGSLEESFRAVFPEGADVVVDASGAAGVIPQAIPIARTMAWNDPDRPGARYIIQGSYPEAFTIPYQDAFQRELSFWIPCDQQPRDLRDALALIAEGKLQVADLIGATLPPSQAPEAYAELRERRGGLGTIVFQWA